MREQFSVKMNVNGDECTCEDNFACEHRVSVDMYIKRVQPKIRSDDYCNKRIQVTLLLYKLLRVMKEGDTFGDVALNRAENKRTASIITTTECAFGTITKEEYDMCQALRELEEDARSEGIKEGIMNTLVSLVKQGLLQVTDAARQADMSESEFQEKLETWEV